MASEPRLAGKVALITGAASGIGAATARLFAREGARLVLTDVNEAGAKALAAEIGQGAIGFEHDVTKEAAWDMVMAETSVAFGRLDVLVNNAGIGRASPILETSYAQWREVIAVNLDSVFLGCRAGIEAMKETGGSIINVSSILGLVGSAMTAAYSASKGGVRLMTKTLALEVAQNGWKIRINSVHPGYIDTPMVSQAVARAPDAEQRRAYLVSQHPLGRLGRAEEIAEGLLYLASDASSFMTGAELVIDGGYTAR
jgi:3(or 17)beta-hydroxysteroid dehydrogenase